MVTHKSSMRLGRGIQTKPMFASLGSELYRTDKALKALLKESPKAKPRDTIHMPKASSAPQTSKNRRSKLSFERRAFADCAEDSEKLLLVRGSTLIVLF